MLNLRAIFNKIESILSYRAGYKVDFFFFNYENSFDGKIRQFSVTMSIPLKKVLLNALRN